MAKSTGAMPWVGAQGLSLANVHNSVQHFQQDFLRAFPLADENAVCSPVSACVLLALLEAAADGPTRTALREALHIRAEEEDVPRLLGIAVRALFDVSGGDELESTNTAWCRLDLMPRAEFTSTIEREYRARIVVVDPSQSTGGAVGSLQASSPRHTGRLLPSFAPIVGPDVLLVLTNAIWFKGKWSNPFDPRRTATAPFRLEPAGTSAIPVQMMSTTAAMCYAETRSYAAVRLPYVSGLSMVIVLPRWSLLHRSHVADLERALAREAPERWIPATQYDEVTVFLPRFSVSSAASLRPLCESLGLADVFNPERADFSRGFEAQPVFVSDIRQEAIVEVNEAGTRAEARTEADLVMGTGLRPPPPTQPVTFCADHPFLFFIVRGHTVMFAGRLMRPAEA